MNDDQKGSLKNLKNRSIESTAITERETAIGFSNRDVLKKIDDSRLDSASINLELGEVQNAQLLFSATVVGSDAAPVDMSDCFWVKNHLFLD